MKTHIVPDNAKNNALAAINTQRLPVKNTLKHYQEFHHQNIQDYFSISLMSIPFIHVQSDSQSSSTHTNRSSELSVISFSTT